MNRYFYKTSSRCTWWPKKAHENVDIKDTWNGVFCLIDILDIFITLVEW